MRMENSTTPLLFGHPTAQTYLLQVHANGSMPPLRSNDDPLFARVGLLRRFTDPDTGGVRLCLDSRHPAYEQIRETLQRLSGVEGRDATAPCPDAPNSVHPESPLGHMGRHAFRILHRVALHAGPVKIERLRKEMAETWGDSIRDNLVRLARDGVLLERDGVVEFAPEVPAAFVRAVLAIGEKLGMPSDVPEEVESQPAAFCRASDGMPLLFGTNRRARNLMAIAKYGPMYWRDVRPLVAGAQNKLEDRSVAPFGRGDVVRVWDTEYGPAVMIDPDYPLAESLVRLLLKMEQFWPVGAYKPSKPAPEPPPRREWRGDRFAVLGGPIKTQILATLGVLGWTFEALCCEVLKYDRVTVKNGIVRLEDERKDKILVGDRPRGPGMNVRTLTIRDDFPAKVELMEFLRAFVEVHADFGDRVRDKIDRLHPKTKAHMRKRGLL